MSIEDIQTIVDIAVKPHAKTQNRLVMAVIVLITIPTILLGIDIGNWSTWRDEMTTWKSGIELLVKDHEKAIITMQAKQEYSSSQKPQNK